MMDYILLMKEEQVFDHAQSKKRQAESLDESSNESSERPAKVAKLKESFDGVQDPSLRPSCSKDQDEMHHEDPNNSLSMVAESAGCVIEVEENARDADNGNFFPPHRASGENLDSYHECREPKTEPLYDRIPALTAKPGDAAEPGASLVNKDPRALHLKLLFQATVKNPDEIPESSSHRRRTFSDSYRPELSLVRQKNDSAFFLMPAKSYSVDDLSEVFQNSKLDYFRATKVNSRKCVKIDIDRPSAPKVFQTRVNIPDISDLTNRALRRCQCLECDQGGGSLLPALTLYPTDLRGHTDYNIARRYGFQARLVRPHPRSYRTARGGHMQWCRYEEDLIKLPLCLQFEVAFTAPDRHRIKLDIQRSVENAPTDIGELGFYFDEADGILKEKDTNTSGFYYVKDRLDKDKRRSRYILAVLGSYNFVSNLMIRENLRVVRKQILRLNGLYDVYSPTIYLSEEAGKRDKLIVLMASKRVARPGVWSVRTLLHREGGINIGSMLPYIRQGHLENYSVLVANPNENHFVHPNLVDISHIPKHSSPAEHLAALWAEEIIPATYARHVYLVLHETAYQAFFSPLIRERPRQRESPIEMERNREEFFHQLQERVRGVALIGAVPQMGMNLALTPTMTRWMLENIINFVPSTEPPETFLKTHAFGQMTDIRQLSAGTKDHDRIPETVRPVVFRFFASQQRKWIRKNQQAASTSTSPEIAMKG